MPPSDEVLSEMIGLPYQEGPDQLGYTPEQYKKLRVLWTIRALEGKLKNIIRDSDRMTAERDAKRRLRGVREKPGR